MSLDRYDTSGSIEAGQLKVRHREQFERAMREMREGEVIVSIRKAHATRTPQMNRLYWRWYVTPLAEYTGYSPQAIHSYLKQRFITAPQIVIANADGEIVDEASIEPTTTTLPKEEFSNYLNAIAEFSETLNVHVGPPIPDPAFSYE